MSQANDHAPRPDRPPLGHPPEQVPHARPPTADVAIVRWSDCTSDCTDDDKAALAAQIDAIFFEASRTKTFASARERQRFRHRWLGLYEEQFAETFFVAIDGRTRLTGYLAGAFSDPLSDPRFAEQAIAPSFGAITARYPAHFHINVTAEARGRGVGSKLVAAFAHACRCAGLAGFHVVTAAQSRNVGFYRRCGLEELARAGKGAGATVLLVRRFGAR